MKRLSTVLTLSAAVFAGCSGGKTDNGPTICGFTPALRAEMRKVIAENDSAADPDKTVDDFMASLKKYASDGLHVKPNAAGDYELPPEQEQFINKYLSSNQPGAIRPITKEFMSSWPKWVEALIAQDDSGTITPERKEVLGRYVFLTLQMGLSK